MKDAPTPTPDAPPLFDAFPPTPTEAWEAKIEQDLKGKDRDRALVWRPREGFAVEPYYREGDVHPEAAAPGAFPYLRGARTGPNTWLLREDLTLDAAAEQAADALRGDADVLGLVAPAGTPDALDRLTQALRALPAEASRLHVGGAVAPSAVLKAWLEAADAPAGTLACDVGPMPEGGYDAAAEAKAALEAAEAAGADVRTLFVDGTRWHDAGAQTAQELAYTLGAVSDVVAGLTAEGVAADTVARHLHVALSMGTSYFMGIAKLRAFRMLYAQVLTAYGADADAARPYVQVQTSARTLTRYDRHVNLLRGTTQAAAAVIGGCDVLAVQPFDGAFGAPGPQARRLARNTQHVLKHESYLDRVTDPSAGSYYVETITEQLADAAWTLFQALEAEGGLAAALEAGRVQEALGRERAALETAVANRRRVFVGTNQYPNPDETLLNGMDVADDAPSAGDLPRFRETAAFERLRLATERYAAARGGAPVVFLLPIGTPAVRTARATFARNFFGCAGYRIVEPLGFDTVDAGLAAADEAGADVVVLCSSDPEYATYGPALGAALEARDDAPVYVVAGYPKDQLDALRAAGVDAFIHLKADLYDTLLDFHRRLGIDAPDA